MPVSIIFIFGLLIGSFLNVVLHRLQTEQSIIWPASHCPTCKKPINWYDNIPILSFIVLKAKCRHCHGQISWQYPLVELATGIISAWAYCRFGWSGDFFRTAIFGGFLLIIFVYDLRYYLILDQVIIPAMVTALLINLSLGLGVWGMIIGFAIGGGFFLAQFVVSSGRWIGGGDIRLGALMGLMLGWKMVLVALFLAYFSGAIVGIILILAGKKKMSSQIPFGTFLSIATFLTLLFGQPLLNWYLNLINF